MSPESLLFLSSIGGAATFFAAGVMTMLATGRRSRAVAGMAEEKTLILDPAKQAGGEELARLRSKLSEAERKLEKAQQEVGTLTQSRDEQLRGQERLNQDLARIRGEVEAAREQAKKAREERDHALAAQRSEAAKGPLHKGQDRSLADAEAKLQQAEEKAKNAAKAQTQVEARLQQAEGKAQQLEARLHQAETKAQQAEAKAQQVQARAQQAETKAAQVEAKVQQAEAKATQAEERMRVLVKEHAKALSEIQTRLQDQDEVTHNDERASPETVRIMEELAAVREEKSRLAALLKDAEDQLVAVGNVEAMKRELDEQRLELAVTAEKMKEFDGLREETVRLRIEASDIQELKRRLLRLTEDNQQLRAAGFVQARGSEHKPETISRGEFSQMLKQFSQATDVRSIAVADELGFPISGSGAEVESLAAFCGLAADLGNKARNLLPIGSVRRVTLEAEHGVTISACPVRRPDFEIALATLTIGPGPDPQQLTRAAEAAADSFERSDRASAV